MKQIQLTLEQAKTLYKKKEMIFQEKSFKNSQKLFEYEL